MNYRNINACQQISEEEHLRNIQEQLLLNRLAECDVSDVEQQALINQALKYINPGVYGALNISTPVNYQNTYNNYSYEYNNDERENEMKDNDYRSTNDQLGKDFDDGIDLIDWIGAIVKWLNSQFINAILGILNRCWKLIAWIPTAIKNLTLHGFPWLWKKSKQFVKFLFSDRFLKLSINIISLLPLLSVMIVFVFWPFGIYFYFYHNLYWMIGGIVWSIFFGVYGIVQGWKHDIYAKMKYQISKKVKKYNTEYFKSENVLKRQIEGIV